jgi:hypothetical protein
MCKSNLSAANSIYLIFIVHVMHYSAFWCISWAHTLSANAVRFPMLLFSCMLCIHYAAMPLLRWLWCRVNYYPLFLVPSCAPSQVSEWVSVCAIILKSRETHSSWARLCGAFALAAVSLPPRLLMLCLSFHAHEKWRRERMSIYK